MVSSDEAQTKRKCTNFELCIICQEETNELLVNCKHTKCKYESHRKLLSALHQRAKFGNLYFVLTSRTLEGIESSHLQERHASWHASCYKNAVNHTLLARDKKKYTIMFVHLQILFCLQTVKEVGHYHVHKNQCLKQ